MLIICGFFLLLSVIGHVIMQTGVMSIASAARTSTNPEEIRSSAIGMYKGIGIYYLGIFPFLLSIFLVTYSYMAISIEKKDGEKPTLEEVWGYFKYYFFRGLGSFILIAIIMFVGFILCLLPGIYVAVVLSLVLPVIVFENASFSYAFNKSFKLIGGNWWLTFGLQFVMGIIVAVAAYVASIPVSILSIISVFGQLGKYGTPVIILSSIVLHTIMLIGYALIGISIALCYFCYSEQKEGTGLMSRINNLGTNDDDTTHLPTEQY